MDKPIFECPDCGADLADEAHTQTCKNKLIDSKCYDLAVHFYTDNPPRAQSLAEEQKQLNDLATTIQQTVEDWFKIREAQYNKPKGIPSGSDPLAKPAR